MDAVTTAIRQCAASFAAADEFSGIVVLEREGRILLQAPFGASDAGGTRPNTIDTPFNIASVGKIFTATAIGQLIDRGKLRLDEAVGPHLPELPADLARVTVGQLLNHSSGVGNIVNAANQPRLEAAATARELLDLVAREPRQFEPGTRHFYSNTGPIILGALVEVLSGQTFADYVRTNIFRPAGMTVSTVKGAPPNAAEMLTRSEVLTGEMHITLGAQMPRRRSTFMGGGAYGAGYSSTRDLLRFAAALRNGRLLSERTRAQLWSGGVPVMAAGPGQYAYGFQVSEEGGVRTVGHSGLAGGANAEFHWAPEAGWTLVVLSNFDPMSATIIGTAARLALTGAEAPENACEAVKQGRGMPMPAGGAPPPGRN